MFHQAAERDGDGFVFFCDGLFGQDAEGNILQKVVIHRNGIDDHSSRIKHVA
ncbi:MAG: hypothetical protein II541_12785 [Prevotella sp.]|nr:hypothetical protein [Prevotella sp.]